jgi:hypothetical protein
MRISLLKLFMHDQDAALRWYVDSLDCELHAGAAYHC